MTQRRWRIALLTRLFFRQLVASEHDTDIHRQQAGVVMLASLLAPGLFLMIELFPEYQFAAIRVRLGRWPRSTVDDLIAWIALLFSTYAMAVTGFLTTLAWDGLSFSRRDATVLGALPMRSSSIASARLLALGVFMLLASVPINCFNALIFALETADQAGLDILARHFAALLGSTMGASTFGFTAIVALRALTACLGGARFAAACAAPIQFLCVVGVLTIVICCPFVLHASYLSAAFTNALPSAWFVGVFERLRGSPRIFDPRFPFFMLQRRAVVAIVAAAALAITLSLIEFRRQMKFVSTESARAQRTGLLRLVRLVAMPFAGRRRAARGMSEFVLITLARGRAQQMPLAINGALAAAIIIAALSRNARGWSSLSHARTAVLWIPLVMAYWLVVAMRAAFLVPREQQASWMFDMTEDGKRERASCASRASMYGVIAPVVLIVVLLLAPIVGWRLSAWHAVLVSMFVACLIELAASLVVDVPFTRPYRFGHSRLRTRWILYLLGMFVFAYVPAKAEISFGPLVSFFALTCPAAAMLLAIRLARGRNGLTHRLIQSVECPGAEESELTALQL